MVEKSEANGIEVKAVIGDGAYSEKENIEYCEKNNLKLASKLSKIVTHGNSKRNNKFEYNKDVGMYVCKAGHMAIRKAKQGSKKSKRGDNSLFFLRPIRLLFQQPPRKFFLFTCNFRKNGI